MHSQEVFLTSKTRPRYSPEFRRQMVELVRAGRDPDDLSRQFEPTGQSIRNCAVQADRQEGRRRRRARLQARPSATNRGGPGWYNPARLHSA
jgi:transposase-like protein